MLKTSAIEERLRAAVGSQNLRAATASDSVCGVQPQFVAEPENEEQLASLLSCANEVGVGVIPRGGGTKLDWGNPPKKARSDSLDRMSRSNSGARMGRSDSDRSSWLHRAGAPEQAGAAWTAACV